MPNRALPTEVAARLAALSLEPPRCVTAMIDVEPGLFGGGVQTRLSDPITPVRAPSILGQLRFFWRLLATESDVARLRDAEGSAFGAAARAGTAGRAGGAAARWRIDVDVCAAGRPVAPPDMRDPGGYLLFPARPSAGTAERPAQAEMKVLLGVRARVQLIGDIPREVRRAFDLWLLLGGVGGRTRRGLGAVQADSAPRDVNDLRMRLRSLLNGAPRDRKGDMRSIRSVHCLQASGPKAWKDAKSCFNALDEWYRSYRQHRRPPAGGTPGRSFWNEPDEIRQATERRGHPDLRPQPAGPHAARPHPVGWARAVLGLPIIFTFNTRRTPNDPGRTELVGRSTDRMASPLLFRPLRLGDGSYVGVVTLLSEPWLPPGGLRLRMDPKPVSVPLTPTPQQVFEDLLTWNPDRALTLPQLW